ncbi:fumarylacetoacetate hydrolase family protein [Bacillus suaedaesalsae]|uniref:Fumarylacetoacetate hydrolase family protein n=1 Tax=Bacillus suaedaesalsae TaxID=2810349 RepID=A0ABS2DHT4_9BACI|nr:fumarylacetoacetate hydrolase family protein [Bacillus suaedaesalsae]MBM6617126.1 fumarylacetoacetate hydrolase family protein [Bacillus suaedaesalsae]
MKLATAKLLNGEQFVGVILGDKIIHIKKAEELYNGESSFPNCMQQVIDQPSSIELLNKLLENIGSKITKCSYQLDDVTLEAPIPTPRKNIFCVGKNYVDHAIEMGSEADIPEDIIVFTKAPTTVLGHEGTVLNHRPLTEQLDYEGELAVVIGKKGRGISEDEASSYIFGYTIINDITARDLQAKHKQFFIGKSLDTTCPMGPWIVHHSGIQDANNLNITTKINGEVRQDSNTKNCIFSIEKIISILSQGITLEPGDIIATGTPAGVGKGFKPPKFLRPGDVMEVTVEGIGTLVNKLEK